MAVTRPLKEGSVTTYQQKVAAGFPDILASEMDADLDTIYAAWNGGVGTANIVDGSITDAKIANVGWNKLTSGTVAVGAASDLTGTYPAPTIAAGKVGKAKLGPDCSGLVYADLTTPQNLGTSSTAQTTLLDLSAMGTLLTNRRYRLTTEGFWSKAVACDLTLALWMGAPGQVVSGYLSPSSITTESIYYIIDYTFFYTSGGLLYIHFNMTISNGVAGSATPTGFGRSLIKVNAYTGYTGQPPLFQIGFSVANAGNGVARYQAMVEVL